MANVLSLALKISADSTGLKLDPVQRALVNLGTEADKLTSVFDKFKGSSAAAGEAQEQAARKTQELINALRDGGSATEFAANFAKLTESVKEQAAAFERGAEITKKYTSEESLRAQKIAELQRLLDQGAIKEDIYAAAVADVSGANAAAAEAEKQRAAAIAEAESQRQKLLSEGASLTERFSSAEEKRAAQLQRVDELLRQGAITEEIATRARAEFSGEAAAAAAAEQRFADQKAAAAKIIEANLSSVERAQKAYDAAVQQAQELERAGLLTKEQLNAEINRQSEILAKATASTQTNTDAAKKQALQFNELTGIFAALPGPLGNIAGRISGLASAGEGLARVFSGGLTQGFTAIGSSITALINPFTVAVAGFAAFGAAANAVVSGLASLDDRVEKLGNTADKLGTSFEFVQVLDEAARRSGTSIDTVSAAFGRLQKSLLGVDEESKSAQQALATIGVTAEELKALSPEEQYRLIGERLSQIEDPAKRTATATQLFGKAGAELLPFFNNLGGAADDMARFNATISSVDRGRIDALGASFDAVFVSLRGLGQNLLTPFAGLVDGIATVISEVIGAITKAIKPFTDAITPALDAVGKSFEAFAASIADGSLNVTESLGPIGDIFESIFDVLSAAVDAALPGIQSAFDAITETVTELGGVFSDSFNAVFEALGEFGSSVSELLGFGDDLSGIGTAIGEVWGAAYETLGQVVSIIGEVIEVISRLGTIVTVSLVKAATVITNAVAGFLEFTGLGSALQSIGGIISSVFGGVASVFGTIAEAIGGTVGRLLTLAENFLGIERSTEGASKATEQLADSADQAAGSSEELAAAQKKAGDEANRRAEEARKIADEETKRVDKLLELQDPIDKLSQDITATNNEIVRTEAALAEARAAGATEEANRLTARLAKLDQLQQGLIDRSEEAAQGFNEGFDKAFADVDKGLGGLIGKAEEFGNEGAVAASQLTEGIEKAKEAVKDGILNKEAFDAEVKRQKQLYEDRVKDLQEAAKITEKLYEKEGQLLEEQFKIRKEREEELAAIRTGSVKIDDIRSGGIDDFFNPLQQDPAIAEAKKQLKELEKIRSEISKLNAQKVDILTGTG
jgi:phage-related protein